MKKIFNLKKYSDMTNKHLERVTKSCNQIEFLLMQIEACLLQEDINEIPYESCSRCDSLVILDNIKKELEGFRENIDLLEALSIIRKTNKGRKLIKSKNDKKGV